MVVMIYQHDLSVDGLFRLWQEHAEHLEVQRDPEHDEYQYHFQYQRDRVFHRPRAVRGGWGQRRYFVRVRGRLVGGRVVGRHLEKRKNRLEKKAKKKKTVIALQDVFSANELIRDDVIIFIKQ